MKAPKPILSQILGERLEEQPTKSGLILPTSNLAKYQSKVLAVGPKVKSIKVGDTVRYDPNTAQNYDEDGKKYVFFKEEGGIFVI